MPNPERRIAITPPQFAARYGVNVDKVLGWIRSGELRAINVAQTTQGRPRWRITEQAIADFEMLRAAQPNTARRNRTYRLPEVHEYVWSL